MDAIPGQRRAARLGATVLLACVLAMTAAACGSSKAKTSSSAAAATTPTSSAGGATASTPSSGGSANVAAATKALTADEATPKSLPVTTPLKSTPPKGKTFVFMECETPQCQSAGLGMKAAASALGWKLKVITFNLSNAQTLTSGMQQALQYKPVAVGLNGIVESGWASEIPAYKAAGVPIITYNLPGKYSAPVIAAVADDGPAQGKQLADWFMSTSKGTGKVLVVDLPEFALLSSDAVKFNSVVAAQCPKCSTVPLNVTLAEQENNTTTATVVSALRRNPSIKYVVATDGIFIAGLPTALKAAGIKGVQIGSGQSTVENEQDVKAGTEDVASAANFQYIGWISMDAAARHLEKMSFAMSDGGMPEQLYTRTNLSTPSESADIPTNYPQLFKKLWKVSQ